MEQTATLKTIGIGTKEAIKLQAKPCVVEAIEDKLVEKAKASKAVFHLRHPDSDDQISVSSVFVLRKRKDKEEIVSVATWYNLDADKMLQKDSALALLLKYYGANNVLEMVGKTVETKTDADGYLAIKAY